MPNLTFLTMVALVIFIPVLMSAALEYSYMLNASSFTKRSSTNSKTITKIIHNFRIQLNYYAAIKMVRLTFKNSTVVKFY